MISRERLNAIDEEWRFYPEKFRTGCLDYWKEVRLFLFGLVDFHEAKEAASREAEKAKAVKKPLPPPPKAAMKAHGRK